MALIVEDYNNYCAFTISTESLGPIRVWKFKAEKIVWESKLRFRMRDNLPATDFIRVFVSVAARHLNLEREKQEGEPITADEANKLTEDELEMISGETIKHHKYLFEDRGKPDHTQHTNKEGKEILNISYEKLDIPQNESESNNEYLRRLILLLSEREKIEEKRSREMMSKSFSELTDANSRISNSLIESFNNLNTYAFIPPPPNPQHKTNQILEDLLENSSQQSRFNEAVVNSVGTTANAVNRIEKWVEGWEQKFDKDSVKAERQGKLNIWIQVILGIIALLALFLAYKSYQISLKSQNPPPVAVPASPESPQGETK